MLVAHVPVSVRLPHTTCLPWLTRCSYNQCHAFICLISMRLSFTAPVPIRHRFVQMWAEIKTTIENGMLFSLLWTSCITTLQIFTIWYITIVTFTNLAEYVKSWISFSTDMLHHIFCQYKRVERNYSFIRPKMSEKQPFIKCGESTVKWTHNINN